MRLIGSISLFVSMALFSGAQADTVQVGMFEVDLPQSMRVEPCPGCFDSDAQVLIEWRPELTAAALAEAVRQARMHRDREQGVLDMVRSGRLGAIDLVAVPVEKHNIGKPFEQQHKEFCKAFRDTWSYGFGRFDPKTNIGHCATPLGALVYTVCAYHTEGILCGSGLHFLESARIEDDGNFLAAFRRWEEKPTPDSEKAVLEHLRAAALVEPVEQVVRSARPRPD